MSLESVGVSEFDEQVYRDLLRMPNTTVSKLAAATSRSTGRVRAAIGRLQDAGLVQRAGTSDGEVTPLDPYVAVTALAGQRRGELDRLGGLVEELASDFYAASVRDRPDRLVKIIEGSHEVARWFRHLQDSARSEVMVLIAPPYLPVVYPPTDEATLIARGVRYRIIYGRDEVLAPGVYADIVRDMAVGEDARMLPVVPLKLLIVDRSRALLPLADSDRGTRNGAILVERSQLSDALIQLFDMLWEQAVPLSGPDGSAASSAAVDPRDAADRALLRLLLAGLPDVSVARQLGISERTLRRRINLLLERLGATSRFQAGAQAARRGWL